VTNVLLAGVGGQGILLASRLLATVAMRHGLDVKCADVHGMAQRGGSVMSQLRMGARVFSPVIPMGEAEILLALEKLEALRYAHWARPGARVWINDMMIQPVSVSSGAAAPPEDLDARLREVFAAPRFLDAQRLALEAGSPRASNTVLLGALSTDLPFETGEWEAAIRETVNPKFVDLNLKAFWKGRQQAAL